MCRPQLVLWAGSSRHVTPLWEPVPTCMQNRLLSCSASVEPQGSAYEANTASHEKGTPALFKGLF